LLQSLASADESDTDTFEGKSVALGIDQNGCEVGVFSEQLDPSPGAVVALDGDFIANAGDDDLTITRFGGAAYREQIAIEDASVAHAHAADLQQIVRGLGKQLGVQGVVGLDMGLGQDGAAGCDPTDQRERERDADGAGRGVAVIEQGPQPDAAGCP